MPRVPISTPEQIRQQKAIIRSEVHRLSRREAQGMVSDLLQYPPVAICNMQIGYLLQWIPHMKIQWINDMLDEVGVTWVRQIYRETYSPNFLTNMQRVRLAALVKDTHATW